ncbi:MAG: HAMP domain-containing histidine kinase [Candidatus Hydrogenedentes bacterium]|nr:HAMP domain-containing histidine kinase [Candidatus Hydrogenedentota bacterium]
MHRNSEVCSCVSGVTHDVNNLLGAAMAYAELVSFDEGISDDSKKMLSQVVDGITKCSRLISSLTSISRKERPDINLVAPQQLMDEVLVLRDYEFKVRQITVERNFEINTGTLAVDLPKLKMALVFLLVNAQDAVENTAQKRVKVTVGNAGDDVYFDIWDSGPGLNSEQTEAAFDAFQTSWSDGTHMGLGLFSARKIAEFHGGSLTYTQERGFRLLIKRDNGLMQMA